MVENKRVEILHNILQEDKDIIINIPLKDLIWTIICYSYNMRDIEDEMFKNYPYTPLDISNKDMEYLSTQKEYHACRRDELARLISTYSDFNTQRVWVEVDKIFKNYNTSLKKGG